MKQLFDWLFSTQGVFFLIIFGGWIISSIGGAMQKVAKRAAEQQARQQRKQQSQQSQQVVENKTQHVEGQMRRMHSSMGQMARAQPAKVEAPVRPSAGPAARPAAQGPSEVEIAREIRRLMGMEPVALQQEPPAPRPQPLQQQRDAAIPQPSSTRRHAESGHLAEEVLRREQEVKHLGSLQDRDFSRGSKIAERRLDTVLTRRFDQEAAAKAKVAASRRRDLGRALDMSRPASAFLAGEVFGQPRALKGWDT